MNDFLAGNWSTPQRAPERYIAQFGETAYNNHASCLLLARLSVDREVELSGVSVEGIAEPGGLTPAHS